MVLTQQIDGCIDLLGLHLRQPIRYPFVLESLAAHAKTARYDVAFAFPAESIEARMTDAHARAEFFPALASAWRSSAIPAQSELPFVGGWFFLLGYEAAQCIEPNLDLPPSPHDLVDAIAVRCPAAVIVDRLLARTILVAESDPAQLAQMLDDCLNISTQSSGEAHISRLVIEEEPPAKFIAGVERTLEYLRAGDIFQANLSRRWQGRFNGESSYGDLYKRLRTHNPAPFTGLAVWREHAILSSSPERMVQVDAGVARTRPIAGTRPRSDTDAQDTDMRSTLISSLKERAEHIMLIDLERNDLGRIARPGSVEVTELMAIESYAHVHHIVSEVSATLRDGLTALDALQAVFPGGTITGCPKLRAMEIIAELEGEGRGPYCGSMGYWSRCGRMDSNILIRTIVCKGDRFSFRTGAGIVADSDPQAELAETRAKARGLLLAVGAVSEAAS